MKRPAILAGLALVPIGWLLAAGGLGMTGHMAGHMVAVAIAAPLIAFGLSDSRFDPAARWPRLVTPIAMMLVELAIVWVWHLPALRAAVHAMPLFLAVEQASFLAAGLLLWAAAIRGPHRMAGIGALLLTSMHMTLLGVLVGLAPRPLYPHMHGLADQQLGGVVMLLIGAGSYLMGGLALLVTLLREREGAAG